MLAVRTSTDATGDAEPGIRKDVKKRPLPIETAKQKKKKHADYLKAADKLLEKQLERVEEEKRRFTPEKTKITLLQGIKRTAEQDKELADAYQEAGRLYKSVIVLYGKLFDERIKQRLNIEEATKKTRTSYKKVKSELIAVREERTEQAIKGQGIAKRLQLAEQIKIPASGDKRLTKEELQQLGDNAILYRELYDEALLETQQDRALRKREKASNTRKNRLKARKEILEKSLSEHDEETQRLRRQLSTFTSRNAYTASEPKKQLVEEEEEVSFQGEESDDGFIDIITCSPVAATPPSFFITDTFGEEESGLSETVDSDRRVTSIDDIREKLADGNFVALRNEFNKPFQQVFLRPLIDMYSKQQFLLISQVSLDLIELLLDTRSEAISSLYAMLVPIIQPPEKLRAYLPSAKQKDLDRLVSLVPNTGRVDLLVAIRTLLYGEESSEEAEADEANILVEERKSEAEVVVVEPSETIKTIEYLKAASLLYPYVIIGAELDQHGDSCLYRAQHRDVNIDDKISVTITLHSDSHSAVEDEAHQLLSTLPGFIQTKKLFRLEVFPTRLATPCAQLTNKDLFKPYHVYMTEFLPVIFRSVIDEMDDYDKFCALFELLASLRLAKEKYGIQHNALDLYNLKFKSFADMTTRVYKLDDGSKVECASRYRILLTGFDMVSLSYTMASEQRQLLDGLDYNSFERLAMKPDMQISDSLTKKLNQALKGRRSIKFDLLMGIMSGEIPK